MIAATCAVLAVGLTALLHRGSKRVPWWIAGAVATFVVCFGLALLAQSAPSEGDVASAYRHGDISYNDYVSGTEGAHNAFNYAGIAAALATVMTMLVGRTVSYYRR